MGFITPALKEEIRRRIPLEEILPDYNVHLLAAGRKWKALCPFHQEKTPSFYVDVEKQLYYCYGCQAGGDLFRFVETMERVDWGDAVAMLARRAGVVLEERPQRGVARRGGGSRVLELYDALEFAASWYHETLLEDPRAARAREYLERRGIADPMWRRFRLGFSLPEWDALIRKVRAKRFGEDVLEEAGLARRREPAGGSRSRSRYDLFRGRLMFPIEDVQHRVIGFGARTLGDDVPKYINTPATALFDKSQVLYGLAQAKPSVRREDEIIIVEGYTDVIVAHQSGLENTVASLGTAFTSDNARQLQRLARRIVMVFDGDAAGQNASERSLDLLVGEDLDVRVYEVRDGKDPCDALLALGGEEFRRRLSREAAGIFEFKWRRTVGALGSEEAVPAEAAAMARARALDEFLRLLVRIKNVVTRKLILREYAERFGIGEAELEERLQAVARSRAVRTSQGDAVRRSVPGSAPPAGRTAARSREDLALGELAELVLRCLLAMPSQAAALWAEVPRALFRGEVGNVIADAIESQLRQGSFSGLRLAKETEHPAASGTIIKLLSQLEQDDGSPAVDHAIVWRNCRRDIRRWEISEQLAELDRLERHARNEEDQARVRSYRSERTRLWKELKR